MTTERKIRNLVSIAEFKGCTIIVIDPNSFKPSKDLIIDFNLLDITDNVVHIEGNVLDFKYVSSSTHILETDDLCKTISDPKFQEVKTWNGWFKKIITKELVPGWYTLIKTTPVKMHITQPFTVADYR